MQRLAGGLYAIGTPTSGMQSNAIYGGAKPDPPMTASPAVFIGDASGAATGIGTGTYIEGRRDVAGAKLVGAEIRANNQSGVAGTYLSRRVLADRCVVVDGQWRQFRRGRGARGRKGR